MAGAGRETVESLDELEETNATVVVLVEHIDDALNKRVVRQLRDIKELFWLKCARFVLIELVEILVQFLQLFFGEVQIPQVFLVLS